MNNLKDFKLPTNHKFVNDVVTKNLEYERRRDEIYGLVLEYTNAIVKHKSCATFRTNIIDLRPADLNYLTNLLSLHKYKWIIENSMLQIFCCD